MIALNRIKLISHKQMGLKGGIYHKTQLGLIYNSNHIEGSRLTHEQTRYIFETNTIGMTEGSVNVNDIVETVNLYYRGLREWGLINGYLIDICLTAQDHYKAALDYFRIMY